MRRVFTFLTAFVLLLASLAVGVFTADLPFWRRAMQLPLAAGEVYLPVAGIGDGAVPPLTEALHSAPLDEAALDAVARSARDAGSRALLVLRGGEAVLVRYSGDDHDGSLMPAGLISRPVLAMVMGLALADGRIDSIDTAVATFLPEWEDEPRGRITLRQLLEDTSGLESGGDIRGVLQRSPWDNLAKLPAFVTSKGVRLLLGNDFESIALRFGLEHEPGGFFEASPANPQLAALILERACATPYEKFLDERLWRMAGAGPAELPFDRGSGMPSAHCCWRATAPGIARIVSLLATDGQQEGRQILPPGWVREMARPARVNAGSGMQLSRLEIGGLEALSAGDDAGSRFWVIPAAQLAIVNIVNPAGTSPGELPARLLKVLEPG